MRTNVYREKILTLLKEKKHHLLTLQAIHKALKGADYSTVFRNVEQLLTLGVIRKVVLDDKSVAYELAGERHDHFICTSCGVVTALHSTLSTKDVTCTSIDEVTVRGVCKGCA